MQQHFKEVRLLKVANCSSETLAAKLHAHDQLIVLLPTSVVAHDVRVKGARHQLYFQPALLGQTHHFQSVLLLINLMLCQKYLAAVTAAYRTYEFVG